jgi:hypothetical protein
LKRLLSAEGLVLLPAPIERDWPVSAVVFGGGGEELNAEALL